MADPIKERITQNIVTTLQGVTTQAGYNETLTVARAEPATIEVKPYQAYVFALDDTPEATPRVTGKEQYVAPYEIAVFVVPSATDVADQLIARVTADIQKIVMVDRNRNGLAFDTKWGGSVKAVNDAGELNGVICTVNVHYRHKENDPFTL